MAEDRLDKIIALNCSLSRRDARRLIKEGKVRVNGEPAKEAQMPVDISADTIEADGFDFTPREHIYIMMNKPEGVISASDDKNKKTVIDLVPPELKRRSLFPAGRLDRDTTGLIIITDDGDFTHRMLSPSHHVFKRYIAEISEPLSEESVALIESGITLDDGTECLPARVEAYSENGVNYMALEIREGKYHQVKRMAAACGTKVLRLRRVKIGALCLDPSLAPGECRELTDEELKLLFENE